MKKIFAIIIIAIIALFAFLILRGSEDDWLCTREGWVKHGNPSAEMPAKPCFKQIAKINSFDECLAAGNPIMESYPRQCRAGDRTFTEDIGNELEKADLIRIDYPRPNQIISSPLNIAGQARGIWFFEADFPVILKAEDGTVLVESYASAQSNWMTEDFVEFKLELTFSKPSAKKGLLILKKDNPSDLPENDDALEVPVFFE